MKIKEFNYKLGNADELRKLSKFLDNLELPENEQELDIYKNLFEGLEVSLAEKMVDSFQVDVKRNLLRNIMARNILLDKVHHLIQKLINSPDDENQVDLIYHIQRELDLINTLSSNISYLYEERDLYYSLLEDEDEDDDTEETSNTDKDVQMV